MMKKFLLKNPTLNNTRIKFPILLSFIYLFQYSQAQIKTKATTFLFLSPECPLCISYVPVINKLYNDYQYKGIDFVGVISGTSFKQETISNYRSQYDIKFPLIVDSTYTISNQFGAQITPEVVLADSSNNIVYKGRIDNWAFAPGKKRKNATEHDLLNALNEYLNGLSIKVKQTKAIGCFIE